MSTASLSTHQNVPDGELINLALAGHTDHFNSLIKRHEKRLYRTAIRILCNPHDAEDALQESFILAFTRLSQFRGHAAFGTWLTRVTVNCCLASLRRRRRSRECCMEFAVDGELRSMEDSIGTPNPSPEDLILWRNELAHVLGRIDQMPSRVKPLFELLVQEHSAQEIADRHRLTICAVKSRISRGRTLIRKSSMLKSVSSSRGRSLA